MIVRNGRELRAEIHGQGSVRARGTAMGPAFSLRGSRMAVPYRIEGRWQGDRLEGSLKVLSVERRFTGTRRRLTPLRRGWRAPPPLLGRRRTLRKSPK